GVQHGKVTSLQLWLYPCIPDPARGTFGAPPAFPTLGSVSRSVLFTVANPNQVANALPVAERLLERSLACRVLVLDPLYHQDAGPALAASPLARQVEVVVAPARGLPTPFDRLPLLARMRAVRAHGGAVVAA